MTEFFVLYTDIVSKPRSGVIFVEKNIIKLINSVAVTFFLFIPLGLVNRVCDFIFVENKL